jgi:hypothetical protein
VLNMVVQLAVSAIALANPIDPRDQFTSLRIGSLVTYPDNQDI